MFHVEHFKADPEKRRKRSHRPKMAVLLLLRPPRAENPAAIFAQKKANTAISIFSPSAQARCLTPTQFWF